MGAARACLCWGFSSFRGSCKPRVVTSCHGNRRHSRGNHPQEVFLKDPPPSSLFSCPPVLCTEARVLARRPARPPTLGRDLRFPEERGQQGRLSRQPHWGPSGPAPHLHYLFSVHS